MQLVKCMKGLVWEIATGIIPFRNMSNFLLLEQNPEMEAEKNVCDNYYTNISWYSSCPITHMNFVLEPKSEYLDPFINSFQECSRKKISKNIK